MAFLTAVFVFALPYLSVQETSSALDIRQGNPIAALNRLATAARLDPLDPSPPRIGGAIALQIDQFTEAEKRFRQAIKREPGGWFAWFGDGLAASALGEDARARRDFMTAASINKLEPVIKQALAALHTAHPLTPDRALQLLASSEWL